VPKILDYFKFKQVNEILLQNNASRYKLHVIFYLQSRPYMEPHTGSELWAYIGTLLSYTGLTTLRTRCEVTYSIFLG